MEKALEWVINSNVCIDGKKWVQSALEETVDYRSLDGIEVISKTLMDNEKYSWVIWYTARMMVEEEYKKLLSFAFEQIPKDFDKNNQDLVRKFEKSEYYVSTINRPEDVNVAVMHIMKTYYFVTSPDNTFILTPDDKRNVTFEKVAQYSIDLLKQRKVK